MVTPCVGQRPAGLPQQTLRYWLPERLRNLLNHLRMVIVPGPRKGILKEFWTPTKRNSGKGKGILDTHKLATHKGILDTHKGILDTHKLANPRF